MKSAPPDPRSPEPNPEVRPSQVTLKTVFTVCFGVLVVAAVVGALAHALVAIALTGASLMIAVALDHLVVMLERRGVRRWRQLLVWRVHGGT